MYKAPHLRNTFNLQKCTPPPLWREARFQVKMYKTRRSRTTFGSWDVEKVHAVVAWSTFPLQNAQRTTCTDHVWRRGFAWQSQTIKKKQLQPPFGQSVDSLCHPCLITTNLSYRFPFLKLPPPPLCGTTGTLQIFDVTGVGKCHNLDCHFNHPIWYNLQPIFEGDGHKIPNSWDIYQAPLHQPGKSVFLSLGYPIPSPHVHSFSKMFPIKVNISEHHESCGGFHSHGGTPLAEWFVRKIPREWMTTRGTPISGNPHVCGTRPF